MRIDISNTKVVVGPIKHEVLTGLEFQFQLCKTDYFTPQTEPITVIAATWYKVTSRYRQANYLKSIHPYK